MSKRNFENNYYYDKDKKWFKTKSGKNGIPLLMGESVKIITAYKNGVNYQTIYKDMSFKNPKVTAGTVRNFIEKWELGLMDKAMGFVCRVSGVENPEYYYRFKTPLRNNDLDSFITEGSKEDESLNLIDVLRPYCKKFGYLSVNELLDDLILPMLDDSLSNRRESLIRQKESIEAQLLMLDE